MEYKSIFGKTPKYLKFFSPSTITSFKKYSDVVDITLPNICRNKLLTLYNKGKFAKLSKIFCNNENICYTQSQIETSLLDYGFLNKDMEFISAITKTNIYISDFHIENIMNNEDYMKIFFESNLHFHTFYKCALKNGNIKLLELLHNNGHNFRDLNEVIYSGNEKTIQYFLDIGYDLQNEFETLFNNNRYGYYRKDLIALVNCGIDISNKLNDILVDGIKEMDDIDVVKYAIENGADNFSAAINLACKYDNNELLIYLLENGGNINDITEDNILCISINIIKNLYDYGYIFSTKLLNLLLLSNIYYEKNPENLEYLFDLIGNFDHIFELENNKSNRSMLEKFVIERKIGLINFLINNCNDKMQLEINRLFIISICDNNIDMAKLFIEAGADIYYLNDLALSCAIFFGNYNIMIYLINAGLNLNNCVDNPFMLCIYQLDTQTYDKLIMRTDHKNYPIFRNDVYHQERNHNKILEYLINVKADKPGDIFYQYLSSEYYFEKLFLYVWPSDLNMELTQYYNKHIKYIIINAIYGNAIDVVKLLLDNGAILNVDSTTIDWLMHDRNEYNKMILFLQDNGVDILEKID